MKPSQAYLPWLTPPQLPGVAAPQPAPKRADCSHNFVIGKDRHTELVEDVLANRSRVLVIDDQRTQAGATWFRDSQAMVLAAALRNNTSFLCVALRAMRLSSLGLTPLFYELARHLRVRVVDLRGTLVPPESFAALLDMVRTNSNIVSVELANCGVTTEVAAAVQTACRLNLMCLPEVMIDADASTEEILRTVVAECDAVDAQRSSAAAMHAELAAERVAK